MLKGAYEAVAEGVKEDVYRIATFATHSRRIRLMCSITSASKFLVFILAILVSSLAFVKIGVFRREFMARIRDVIPNFNL